jgi:hypothetical protein
MACAVAEDGRIEQLDCHRGAQRAELGGAKLAKLDNRLPGAAGAGDARAEGIVPARDRKEAQGRVSISTETSSRLPPSVDWTVARSLVSGFLMRRLEEPEPLALERHSRWGAVLLSDVDSFTAAVERLAVERGMQEAVALAGEAALAILEATREIGPLRWLTRIATAAAAGAGARRAPGSSRA